MVFAQQCPALLPMDFYAGLRSESHYRYHNPCIMSSFLWTEHRTRNKKNRIFLLPERKIFSFFSTLNKPAIYVLLVVTMSLGDLNWESSWKVNYQQRDGHIWFVLIIIQSTVWGTLLSWTRLKLCEQNGSKNGNWMDNCRVCDSYQGSIKLLLSLFHYILHISTSLVINWPKNLNLIT